MLKIYNSCGCLLSTSSLLIGGLLYLYDRLDCMRLEISLISYFIVCVPCNVYYMYIALYIEDNPAMRVHCTCTCILLKILILWHEVLSQYYCKNRTL